MLRDILIAGGVFAIVAGILIAAGTRDESIKPARFDCRMLIGSWHPDVPKEIIEQCRKGNRT